MGRSRRPAFVRVTLTNLSEPDALSTATTAAGGHRLLKAAAVLFLGALFLWSAIVVLFVTIDFPEVAPWTILPSLLAAATGLIWWRRPDLRSTRLLRVARLLSLVAVALLVLWALGLTVVFSAAPFGPEN
jgi:hypothetical protein